MDLNSHETVEQQAIELVSSLGKEHLFVANCPSDAPVTLIRTDTQALSLPMKKPLITVIQE